MRSRDSTSRTRIAWGFTLIEMLIVISIIAILAAIVSPVFSHAKSEANRIVFVGDIRQFADAAMRYFADTGTYVKHTAGGKVPKGWEPYIDTQRWLQPTSIGGEWEVYRKAYGVESAVGVHFGKHHDSMPDEFMRNIDLLTDDGDLAAGNFRKLTKDRFAYIVVDGR